MDIESRIHGYFQSTLGELPEGVEADKSLFRSGMLDSLRLMDLLTFLEGEFSIRIHPMDLSLENFDTIRKIRAFIEGKRG